MAGRYGLVPQLDIEQILMEAQHRWLRPAEICEILKNHKRFRIAPEPPNRPPSGSLFLFDRKVLRYFRKDGHNWRKKKDGKTIKEAHERLKSGSIDVLHCYYAHGEENECFQRRSYWMLEEDFMHIVLVHYLEVKGGKSSLHRHRDIESTTRADSNSFTTQSQSQSQSQNYLSTQSQQSQSYSQSQPYLPAQSQSQQSQSQNYFPAQSQSQQSQTQNYFPSEPESSISGHNSEFEDAESVLQFSASANNASGAGYNAFPQTHLVYGDGRGPINMMNNNNNNNNNNINNMQANNAIMNNNDINNMQINNAMMNDSINMQNNNAMMSDSINVQTNNAMMSDGINVQTNNVMMSDSINMQTNNAMMSDNINLQTSNVFDNFLPDNNQSYGGVVTGPNLDLYFSQEDLTKAFGEPSLGNSPSPPPQLDTSAWPANQSDITTQTLTQTPYEISFNSNNNQGFSSSVPFVNDDIKLDNPVFDGVFSTEQTVAPAHHSLLEFLPDHNSYLLQEAKLTQQTLNLNPNDNPPLEKGDSFSRWMSTELVGTVDSDPVLSNSDSLWNSVETDGVLDDTGVSSRVQQLEMFTVPPVISQDQLFSIEDYKPSWAYVGVNTKVLVTGKFMKSHEEVRKCKWSCMFGEIEVSADLLSDGSLRCYTPSHKLGRVPFYITGSNRLACSEIREFEFREMDSRFSDSNSNSHPYNNYESDLSARLEKLLTLDPNHHHQQNPNSNTELKNKINALMSADDEWSTLFRSTEGNLVFPSPQKDEIAEGLMKEKLRVWLLSKVCEEGKGPCVLDKEGQGVIHLAAALGFDWAMRPIITAGVNANFRDAHGWTALHWAAFCGRESIVVALIALGADPGALTDPSPEFPAGRTPADLASSKFHKGISGFLAESSLTSLLEILTLKDPSAAKETVGKKTVRFHDDDVNVSGDGDGELKDSLCAVRNAAQAAARIYQVFRMQSFQRKQLDELDGEGSLGISDERALAKAMKAPPVPYGSPYHDAAIRIQNKFRGYKGRKEFLLFKQRIVKLQAHVRGHQVRKHYRKIIWSVGIVEKIILRWRRKGHGLRGFAPSPSPSPSNPPSNSNAPPPQEDSEEDFLREGRRQTEARLEKALARVKSMVQYPEARAQYGRLLGRITQLQESQALQERILKEAEEEAEVDDFMVEFKDLWEDDAPMFGF